MACPPPRLIWFIIGPPICWLIWFIMGGFLLFVVTMESNDDRSIRGCCGCGGLLFNDIEDIGDDNMDDDEDIDDDENCC